MSETRDWAQSRTTSISSTPNGHALPLAHLERVEAWGGASFGSSFVYRPVNIDQLRDLFALARSTGRSLSFRGGGNSYGDAAMNDEQILVNLRRFNRVVDWVGRVVQKVVDSQAEFAGFQAAVRQIVENIRLYLLRLVLAAQIAGKKLEKALTISPEKR